MPGAWRSSGAIGAFALLLLPTPSRPAAARCNCVYAAPCTITTNIADFTSGSEHTFCTVRTSGGVYSVAYELTTPSGEQYRIENPVALFSGGWFINGDPGVRLATDDANRPCYRTARLQICLGR